MEKSKCEHLRVKKETMLSTVPNIQSYYRLICEDCNMVYDSRKLNDYRDDIDIINFLSKVSDREKQSLERKEVIPLRHAAEVLAKYRYEMREAGPTMFGTVEFGDWSKATPEERQEEINEAKELLKK